MYLLINNWLHLPYGLKLGHSNSSQQFFPNVSGYKMHCVLGELERVGTLLFKTHIPEIHLTLKNLKLGGMRINKCLR